ncbi:Periplasmic glucans biosynthesis protein [gamma proteobacterium HdN1]|nr:Periplasmic glucans biosynthesis protein [gamma proteobacterium HdN1]
MYGLCGLFSCRNHCGFAALCDNLAILWFFGGLRLLRAMPINVKCQFFSGIDSLMHRLLVCLLLAVSCPSVSMAAPAASDSNVKGLSPAAQAEPSNATASAAATPKAATAPKAAAASKEATAPKAAAANHESAYSAAPASAKEKAKAEKPTPKAAPVFGLKDVVEKARVLAEQPYQAPDEIPNFMRELSYTQYQDIRFKPEKSLWRERKSRFQVMMVPPGLFYTHAVRLNEVLGTKVKPIAFEKDHFSLTDQELQKLLPPDLGYAGFKLTFPFSSASAQNQFLVFAGASYFRGVGKPNGFGLSARGIAVDTGLPSGEQFPSFVEFWLVRPAPMAKDVTLYGLLDGPALSGAYQFQITPGESTRVKVQAVLFPRTNIKMLGIAPLTSMYYYGENSARPRGQWRGEVHDSDGLLIHNGGSGEWLWRPLINPAVLSIDYFNTQDVRGFGVLQRDTHFDHYNDLEALYHKRPSAWVVPENNWGPGDVVLVQLPTADETNDNVVAFWTPRQPPAVGQPYQIGYTLSFGSAGLPQEPLGHTVATHVGSGNASGGGRVAGAYRIVVDFVGGGLARVPKDAGVTASVSAQSQGEIVEHYVEYNAQQKTWRLSMLAKPAEDQPLDVRAYLTLGGDTLTETWTYHLAPQNDIEDPK